jgi:hypothetical protein
MEEDTPWAWADGKTLLVQEKEELGIERGQMVRKGPGLTQKHRMTSITNEDDLSFRQAVKGVPFHLRVHFHLGTLPNRTVSIDADGQNRQRPLSKFLHH